MLPTEFSKGSVGTIGSVGSPGCIFDMESILLLPNQQLGENDPNQRVEAKEARQMSRAFYIGFGNCLIEECYLSYDSW